MSCTLGKCSEVWFVFSESMLCFTSDWFGQNLSLSFLFLSGITSSASLQTMHACPLVFNLMAWGSGLKAFLYLGSVNVESYECMAQRLIFEHLMQ